MIEMNENLNPSRRSRCRRCRRRFLKVKRSECGKVAMLVPVYVTSSSSSCRRHKDNNNNKGRVVTTRTAMTISANQASSVSDNNSERKNAGQERIECDEYKV